MKPPTSRTSLLLVLPALPLLGCSATLPRPPPLPPPQACLGTVYAPTGETTTMSVEFNLQLSDAYDFVGSCLWLDGALLTTPEEMRASSAHLRAGQSFRWQGPVSRDGAHKAALYVLMRGAGEMSRYWFQVRSVHDFVLTGDAAPALRLVLREMPGEVRLGWRPVVQWDANAGMARP